MDYFSQHDFDDILVNISKIQRNRYMVVVQEGREFSEEQVDEISLRPGIRMAVLQPRGEPVAGWVFFLAEDAHMAVSMIQAAILALGGNNVVIAGSKDGDDPKYLN